MPKTYSGERIPGTIRYVVLIRDENSSKKWNIPESSGDGFDQELSSQLIALAILQDHTNNSVVSESHYRDFKDFCGDLFKQDHWLLHSSRIDLFLKEDSPKERRFANLSLKQS